MTTQTNVHFPSLQWFQSLRALMNESEEKYRALGYADSKGVFKVGGLAYSLVFEVHRCSSVRELEAGEIERFNPDWIIEGDLDGWREMIENIKANGRADSEHTLKGLSLLEQPFRLYGADQGRVARFHRQAPSFQEFLDASAVLDTTF